MAEQGFRKIIITITVISATIIELIDTSIVNVGLSDMSGNLGATLEDVAWVITSYAIANVIIIPMTSFLAARFGRRRYYIGSILLFTAASVACGQAHNIWELVGFRFVQGIGGEPCCPRPRRFFSRPFPSNNGAWPPPSSGLACSSVRPSAPPSGDGSSTAIRGRGSST